MTHLTTAWHRQMPINKLFGLPSGTNILMQTSLNTLWLSFIWLQFLVEVTFWSFCFIWCLKSSFYLFVTFKTIPPRCVYLKVRMMHKALETVMKNVAMKTMVDAIKRSLLRANYYKELNLCLYDGPTNGRNKSPTSSCCQSSFLCGLHFPMFLVR